MLPTKHENYTKQELFQPILLGKVSCTLNVPVSPHYSKPKLVAWVRAAKLQISAFHCLKHPVSSST